ncbi:hypothetical protein PWY87_25405 [Kribbella solani]|uniref:hypothetical protein n=1 Tax=Kribbella solani TaxID=236067 RepID=UPI0029BA309B|nr:hypothetical protein [Kribbella solani]MDX3005039.1 hypothetical protein [Kribbella solani]
MRLRGRDVVALILLGSVLATYSGYLGYGEIAMIHTARAMASIGLILGGIAFVVIRGGTQSSPPPPPPDGRGSIEGQTDQRRSAVLPRVAGPPVRPARPRQ